MLTYATLSLDAVVSALSGLFLFFFPHVFAGFIFKNDTDGVHWHLIRCVGGQLMAGGFVTWRLRKSDTTTHTLCHLLRIIPTILVLMLIFQCRSMTPDLVNLQYLEIFKNLCIFCLVVHIGLLIGNGWHLGKSLVGGNRFGDSLYQLDALASICIGVAWLAFPNWLLHRQVTVSLDDSHSLCGRLMGALFVTSYAVATHALHWTNPKDRTIVVDSRVVCCVAILSAQVWSQFAYKLHWSQGHWVGISLFSTWTVVSLLYRVYLSCSKTKKH